MNRMTQAQAGRRLIVQIPWGPLAMHKAILPAGQTLKVGRSVSAGLAVPHDEMMSHAHFEVAWDGNICRIRDLRSALGTLLDGHAVHEGEAFNASWLRAGSTDFVVYFEGFTPPGAVSEQELPEAAAHKAHALEELRKQEAPLFAVLDAARDRRALVLLRESVEEFRSLYEGPQGDTLAEVAPYLVSLPKDSRLLETLVWEGWGKSWGIYLTCSRPFLEVRRHLRKFLMVEAENVERRLYFRFYDPRVLDMFLSSCTQEQGQLFFGDIENLLLETADGNAITKQCPSIHR